MNSTNEIEIDVKKAERLLRKLILMEKQNLRTKQFNDAEMVKKIKKAIEEEAECY
ncbi:hypothetical protein [Paenibacillus lemnae]|uniref:Uncharacterized protein n=1 Tax=Paenibacillus lemnae TaxID=1330551 RepID=A0A848M5P3_PAELE|nr:hypothetical protein [Paenibacillus lemnae]NMO94924.1 hypothetical protein [Paenibacillus lemnae]